MTSFFIQLISPLANSVFQFNEAHLAEIGVGGTESNLHDIHLVFHIYLRRSCSMSLLMRIPAVENASGSKPSLSHSQDAIFKPQLSAPLQEPFQGLVSGAHRRLQVAADVRRAFFPLRSFAELNTGLTHREAA